MKIKKFLKSVDKHNEKICLKICSGYYYDVELGRGEGCIFLPKYYKLLFFRFLIACFNAFRFERRRFQKYSTIFTQNHFPLLINVSSFTFINRIKELFFVFSGLRHYVKRSYDAEWYEKQVPTSALSFNSIEKPEVSILIYPSYQTGDAINCLRSIKLNLSDKYRYKIYVIDRDAAGQNDLLSKIPGIEYIKNTQNKELVLLCNEIIQKIDSKLICLLNNNALIQPNWLETLIETLLKYPNVACVGSKSIFPYGLLKEAGGIIYNNGDDTFYGSQQHIEDHHYNFYREADYCSGSVLFRKADVEVVGCFDTAYKSPHFGIIDLCFSIRHVLGRKVAYQPLSEVVSFEKVRPQLDKKAFLRKWQKELDWYYSFDQKDAAARKYLSNQSILVVDIQIPMYDKDSGSNRIHELLKILSSLKYHIIFIPADGKVVQPYYSTYRQEGIEIVTKYAGNKYFKNQVKGVAKMCTIAWISRPEINKKFSYVFSTNPSLKWIYDTVDLAYIRFLRASKLYPEDQNIKKKLKEHQDLELNLAKQADLTICITDVEQKELENKGITRTAIIPNIHRIKEISSKTFEDRKGLLFIGSYYHHPNVDAVKWLCGEIMPRVWKKYPEINVTLLGSNPSKEVLAFQNDRVHIPGYIQDVSEYFLNSRIFVSPLRYGAGMKGKIGQSLEYSLPVITTNIGAEGMYLINDENVLIADASQEFASKIINLYYDKILWGKLSANSASALKYYTPTYVSKQVKDILEKISS